MGTGLNTRLKVHAQVLVRLEQEPETQKKPISQWKSTFNNALVPVIP